MAETPITGTIVGAVARSDPHDPTQYQLQVLSSPLQGAAGRSFGQGNDGYLVQYAQRVGENIIKSIIQEAEDEQSKMVKRLARIEADTRIDQFIEEVTFKLQEFALFKKKGENPQTTQALGGVTVFDKVDDDDFKDCILLSSTFIGAESGLTKPDDGASQFFRSEDIKLLLTLSAKNAKRDTAEPQDLDALAQYLNIRTPSVALGRRYMQEVLNATAYDASPFPFEQDMGMRPEESMYQRIGQAYYMMTAALFSQSQSEDGSDDTTLTLDAVPNSDLKRLFFKNQIFVHLLNPARRIFSNPDTKIPDVSAKFMRRGEVQASLEYVSLCEKVSEECVQSIKQGIPMILRSAVAIEKHRLPYTPLKVCIQNKIEDNKAHFVIGHDVNLLTDAVRAMLSALTLQRFEPKTPVGIQDDFKTTGTQMSQASLYTKTVNETEFVNIFKDNTEFAGFIHLTSKTLKRPIFAIVGKPCMLQIQNEMMAFEQKNGRRIINLGHRFDPVCRFYDALYKRQTAHSADGAELFENFLVPFAVVLTVGSPQEEYLLPTLCAVDENVVTTPTWDRVAGELVSFLYTLANGLPQKRSPSGQRVHHTAQVYYVVSMGQKTSIEDFIARFPDAACHLQSLAHAHQAYMISIAQPLSRRKVDRNSHTWASEQRLAAARAALGL